MSIAQYNSVTVLLADPLENGPFAVSNGEDKQRLLRYAKMLIYAVTVIVIAQIGVVLANHAVPSVGILVAVIFLLGMSLWGRSIIVQGKSRRGVMVIVSGLFVSAVVCAAFDPTIMTVSVFAVLLAVGLAMPFMSSQELRRICLISMLVMLGIGLFGFFFRFFDHEPTFISNFSKLTALLLAAAVSLSWLYGFHQRLASLVSDLRLSRQTLEQQVIERTQQLRNELAHAKELEHELRNTREAVVIASEEERRQLRRELHDEFSPTLSGCLLTLANLKENTVQCSPDAHAGLDRVSQSLASLRTEVRQLSYQLIPEFLDLGLPVAIRQLVDRFAEHNPNINIDVTLPCNLPELPAAVERATYHMVQGALQNLERHAQAQKCEVDVVLASLADMGAQDSKHTHVLSVTILDDGVGLSQTYRPGVGMTAMRERAEILGGKFIIKNRPTSGTCFEMNIPLRIIES